MCKLLTFGSHVMCDRPPVNGWRQLDGSWIQSQGNTDNTSACLIPDLAPNNQTYLGGLPGTTPCLFDIR